MCCPRFNPDISHITVLFLTGPPSFQLFPCFLLLFSYFQASYASSDLYSLNGPSSSRNTSSSFNGSQVCMQSASYWAFISSRVCGGKRGKANLLFKRFLLCCSCAVCWVTSASSSVVGLVTRQSLLALFLTMWNT